MLLYRILRLSFFYKHPIFCWTLRLSLSPSSSSFSRSGAVPRDMTVLAAAVACLARLVHHSSNQVGAFTRDVPVLAAAVALCPIGLAVARVVVQASALEANNTAVDVIMVLVDVDVVVVVAAVVVVVVVRRAVHVHGASVPHVSATAATVRVSALVSLRHRGVHARVAIGGRGALGRVHIIHAHVALEVTGRGPVAELVAAVAGHMSLRSTTKRMAEGEISESHRPCVRFVPWRFLCIYIYVCVCSKTGRSLQKCHSCSSVLLLQQRYAGDG